MDSFPCGRQSVSWVSVSWKAAGDYISNANKSPKMLYSAILREVEKWSSEIRIWDQITTAFSHS